MSPTARPPIGQAGDGGRFGPMTPVSSAGPGALLAQRGPALAALVAILTGLPGLWLPLLADDWVDLEAAEAGRALTTPFGYFRPLTSLTRCLEVRLWGRSPIGSHATNVLLLAVAAALVGAAVRRYVDDPWIAGTSGLLFALHPYHVENAAWIAARPDVLYSVLVLAALLTYDRWRVRQRGLPFASVALFESALLAKESAITFPPLLVAIGLLDRRRSPSRAEWRRGYGPMIAVGVAHFLVLRAAVLGHAGLEILGGLGGRWFKNLLAFGAAAILPAQTEFLEERPWRWGGAAALGGLALLLIARRRGVVPRLAWGCAPLFLILLGPGLVSFQERYICLAVAASSAAIAALLRGAGRRPGTAFACLLAAGWLLSAAQQWAGWLDAGDLSRVLIADLAAASRRSGVEEIVVANMPHRVHGAPVAADFGTAAALSGGRRVAVRSVVTVDYPHPGAETLEGGPTLIATAGRRAIELHLLVPETRFSRVVLPRPPPGRSTVERRWATVTFEGAGRIEIRIPLAPGGGRAAYVWAGGRLRPLAAQIPPGARV